MTLGVDNISQINDTNVTEPHQGIGIQEFSQDFAQVFGGGIAGSNQLAGLIGLFFFAFALYKLDVGMDTSIAIMIPLTLFLAVEGFLPNSTALIYGVLLTTGFLVAYGVLSKL